MDYKKDCKIHGEFTTTGPAGKCPQCKSTSTPKKAKNKAGRQVHRTAGKGPRSTRRHDHGAAECDNCRIEKIMVAAGLVPAEKFDQARKIVRDLEK